MAQQEVQVHAAEGFHLSCPPGTERTSQEARTRTSEIGGMSLLEKIKVGSLSPLSGWYKINCLIVCAVGRGFSQFTSAESGGVRESSTRPHSDDSPVGPVSEEQPAFPPFYEPAVPVVPSA